MTGSMGAECDAVAITEMGEAMAASFMRGVIDAWETQYAVLHRRPHPRYSHITGMSPLDEH